MTIELSICIATYKRGRFIGETLDSILEQMQPGVEIVVVDGASPDSTPEVMAEYTDVFQEVRYFREPVNSGVDTDFDKAVGYARGDYCWLMTDDDLLKPGAIAKVMAALCEEHDLIVVNSEIRNTDMSEVFEKQRLKFDIDKTYRKRDGEAFFSEVAAYLSFIGSVVVRRNIWMSRERSKYYGSLFIHVGVIFQSPAIANAKVIASPLITIRYGNAMWTPRSFEIWMCKWPRLVWSFSEFSEMSKRKVCRQDPLLSPKALFHNRALGAYSISEFRRYIMPIPSIVAKVIGFLISIFPANLANLIMTFYFLTVGSPAPMAVSDLISCHKANILSRILFKLFKRGRIDFA